MDLERGVLPFPEAETSGLSLLPSEGRPGGTGEEHAAAAAAKGLRERRVNHIIIDVDTMLTNQDLKEWHINYIENMEIARKGKQTRRLQRAARSNANILVMQRGIGGELQNPVLRGLFSGQAILNAIQGKGGEDSQAARKRKRAELRRDGEAGDEEARRTRAKTQEQEQAQGEIGRGAELAGDIDMELGRDVPLDLGGDDVQSLHSDMPWVPGDQLFSGGGVASSSVVGGPRSVADSPVKARNVRGMSRVSAAGSVRSILEDVAEEGETNLGLDDTADQFEFFGPGK
jgi:hypothetical protein